MRTVILLLFVCPIMLSCGKSGQVLVDDISSEQFVEYIIQKGNQYCDENTYKPVELTEMKFAVRFDSTASYQAQLPGNQYDINKLYGFSDNNSNHHQFSARFGWRWSDKALRLFAYVYNEGTVISKELTTVAIGVEINCSIKVTGSSYMLTVDGATVQLPRGATTEKAKGYQLYPYFGGDEMAPHQIHIWIKDMSPRS